MITRILLIGQGLFREGLEHLLNGRENMAVVGMAETWNDARDHLAELRPDVLIVEQTGSQDQNLRSALQGGDPAPLLESGLQKIKVIHLSLVENRMLVYDWQQVGGATPDDLKRVLRPSLSYNEMAGEMPAGGRP